MASARSDARRIAAAYQAVERLEDFAPGQTQTYRRERLRRYDPFPKLMRRILGPAVSRRGARLVEIGSGSSALAYRLDQDGLLLAADCLEPSTSRYHFAEDWKKRGKHLRVRNHNVDALAFGYPAGACDAIICIDHTFAYLAPYYGHAKLTRLLAAWRRALKPGGAIILEVTLYPKVRVALVDLRWPRLQAFEESDRGRFRFNLAEFRLEGKDRLAVRSLYVSPDGRTLEKAEVSRLFTVANLIDLFRKSGFLLESAWNGPGMSKSRPGDEAVLAVFRKPTGEP